MVQLKVVEAILLERIIDVIELPEHMDCDAGVAEATGVGVTVVV
jgi:hypothetical protein